MPDENDVLKRAARARLRRGKSRGFSPKLRSKGGKRMRRSRGTPSLKRFTSHAGSGSGRLGPRWTPEAGEGASTGWQNQGKKATYSGSFRGYEKVKRARGN